MYINNLVSNEGPAYRARVFIFDYATWRVTNITIYLFIYTYNYTCKVQKNYLDS